MTITSGYVFNGDKLVEYSHVNKFCELLKKNGIDLELDNISIRNIFEHINDTDPKLKPVVDKLYFEHVFYGNQKNIYFHKIENQCPDASSFERKVEMILKDTQSNLPAQYSQYMNAKSFYLLDALKYEKVGGFFILGLDKEYKDNKVYIARFLICQVVLRNGIPEYQLASLEINYREKFYLLMIRNLTNLDLSPDDEEMLENKEDKWERGLNKYIENINKKIMSPLQIIEEFQYIEDRKAMYKMCKDMDEALLKEYREIISDTVGESINKSIRNWMKDLFHNDLPTKPKLKVFSDKISSLLLAVYLEKMQLQGKINLVDKAEKIGQKGYTTRIEFKSNKAGRGATKSKNAKTPIATEDMFHSLYIDFKGAQQLPKWSIAWFTGKKGDYIQTTIHITKNHFKVVFLPKRHLTKEIIYEVIRHIHKYRTGELQESK